MKASKGEDEGGFEGFQGEDEGARFRKQRQQLDVTEHATGGGPLQPPTPVKQQTSLLQTQRNPHANALGGLKTEKNEEKRT